MSASVNMDRFMIYERTSVLKTSTVVSILTSRLLDITQQLKAIIKSI